MQFERHHGGDAAVKDLGNHPFAIQGLLQGDSEAFVWEETGNAGGPGVGWALRRKSTKDPEIPKEAEAGPGAKPPRIR